MFKYSTVIIHTCTVIGAVILVICYLYIENTSLFFSARKSEQEILGIAGFWSLFLWTLSNGLIHATAKWFARPRFRFVLAFAVLINLTPALYVGIMIILDHSLLRVH